MSKAKGARQANVRGAVFLCPLGFGRSLLFFGLPTLAAVFCFYVLMPALIEGGVLPFYAHSIALIIPLAGLLAYCLEGNPFTWPALAARFRCKKPTFSSWLCPCFCMAASEHGRSRERRL